MKPKDEEFKKSKWFKRVKSERVLRKSSFRPEETTFFGSNLSITSYHEKSVGLLPRNGKICIPWKSPSVAVRIFHIFSCLKIAQNHDDDENSQ